MKLPSPGFLLHAFAAACRRFPVAMFCTAVGVAACIALLERDGTNSFFTRIWMVCQLGLPLIVGLTVLAEARGWSTQRNWLLQIAGAAAMAGYFFLLDPDQPSFERLVLPRYMALLLTAHLLVAVAPYMNSSPVADFWEYNKRLFINLVTGMAFSAVLYLGLAAAVLAVDELFNLHINDRIYGRLFVLLAGVFHTSFFLYHFPINYAFKGDGAEGYHAAFRNLCKFILIPIVGLYFLILYAYGTKILVTWDLPHGWVSSLVIGFSVAGIFTYLLNYMLPQQDGEGSLSGRYKRWFWWAVLPLTVLLFVAIGRRIMDYGVTEQRFLVAHTGVWLTAMCLYFLFSKTDNIKFVPLSLGLFALMYAYGPLNAYAVSERSQTSILQSFLEKNARFRDGKLVRDTARISAQDFRRIEDGFYYFERHDDFAAIREWLPMPPDSFPDAPGAYNASRRILHWAGISATEPTVEDGPWSARISPINLPPTGVDVSGYRTYFRLESAYTTDDHSGKIGRYLALAKDGSGLEYREAKPGSEPVVIERFFWPDTTLQLWRKKAQNNYHGLPDSELRVMLAGSKKGSACVVAEELVVEEQEGKLRITILTGGVFLK